MQIKIVFVHRYSEPKNVVKERMGLIKTWKRDDLVDNWKRDL